MHFSSCLAAILRAANTRRRSCRELCESECRRRRPASLGRVLHIGDPRRAPVPYRGGGRWYQTLVPSRYHIGTFLYHGLRGWYLTEPFCTCATLHAYSMIQTAVRCLLKYSLLASSDGKQARGADLFTEEEARRRRTLRSRRLDDFADGPTFKELYVTGGLASAVSFPDMVLCYMATSFGVSEEASRTTRRPQARGTSLLWWTTASATLSKA